VNFADSDAPETVTISEPALYEAQGCLEIAPGFLLEAAGRLEDAKDRRAERRVGRLMHYGQNIVSLRPRHPNPVLLQVDNQDGSQYKVSYISEDDWPHIQVGWADGFWHRTISWVGVRTSPRGLIVASSLNRNWAPLVALNAPTNFPWPTVRRFIRKAQIEIESK
jgi:hypothetical protein